MNICSMKKPLKIEFERTNRTCDDCGWYDIVHVKVSEPDIGTVLYETHYSGHFGNSTDGVDPDDPEALLKAVLTALGYDVC